MSRLTPERLAEIEARCGQMAEEDGSPCRAELIKQNIAYESNRIIHAGKNPSASSSWIAVCAWNEDAQFILHSLADVPELLEEVRALGAERDDALADNARLREALEMAYNVLWRAGYTQVAHKIEQALAAPPSPRGRLVAAALALAGAYGEGGCIQYHVLLDLLRAYREAAKEGN